MAISNSTYKLAVEQMQNYPSALSQADRVMKFCVDNGIATADAVNGKVFNRKGNEYKYYPNKDGYYRIFLSAGKRNFGARPFVHRVIAYALWGDRLFEFEVNHINEIKTDNRAANLELVTRDQNMQHSMNGDKNHMTVLTPDQVREIRRRYKPRSRTDGGHALAREFGVHVMTVFGVINCVTWKHIA